MIQGNPDRAHLRRGLTDSEQEFDPRERRKAEIDNTERLRRAAEAQAEAERRSAQEQAHRLRTVRRNRWVIAGMLLLTFAGLIFAAFQKTDKQRTQSLLSTALSALGGSATAFGAEVLTLRGFSDDVSGVAWSPDSGRLATSVLDKVAKVWNLSDGKGLFTLNGHHGDVYSVAWSPGREKTGLGKQRHNRKSYGMHLLAHRLAPDR